jgi:hypothetical protein
MSDNTSRRALNGNTKLLITVFASLFLAVGMSAWGIYQWAGNRQHAELERQILEVKEDAASEKVARMADHDVLLRVDENVKRLLEKHE